MRTHYERLSAIDAMFLEIEDATAPMHIGSVALFEAAPLLGRDGCFDLDRALAFVAARLHTRPRLRQKLASIPGFGRFVWVDDDAFSLAYHVRHAALPRPGHVRQLKRLAGRILSQPLDRSKPLWEVWFVEGLEGERVAVVAKLHHCMADGVSSGNLLSVLMGTRSDYQPPPARRWRPRARPDAVRLIGDELVRTVGAPLSLLGRRRPAGDRLAAGSRELLRFARDAARGAWHAARTGLRPASATPLNVALGAHRRFDWTRLELDAAKSVGRAAGGTLNDVVLALVTSAVRSFLLHRGSRVQGMAFRVAVPVSLRTDLDRGQLGNRVSSLIVPLPIDEPDPWLRLQQLVARTRALKRSGEREALDLLGRLADRLPLGLMRRASRVGSRSVNMVVTNVPGPPVPVYMLGARMLETYPLVPLLAREALNIALFSYDGSLFWGFNADWDSLPDLHEFVESVPAAFEVLEKEAARR